MAGPSGPDSLAARHRDSVSLFLCGDVMTGRGIDQILPHPSQPRLYERYVRSAREYVSLAEQACGPIPRPCEFTYIWGDLVSELERVRPDVRIVNLETAVTVSENAWPHKGIHYRMNPANAPCLTAAGFDCCVLANNHTLDWGVEGLEESLLVLHEAGLRTAGAGRNLAAACAPATLDLPGEGGVQIFACGTLDSGIPAAWEATKEGPGLCVLKELSSKVIDEIAACIRTHRRPGDVVVMSVHWGGNWGYKIPQAHREFALGLIDIAGVDIVHGHSSHHPKAIEVHRGKLILYGCGDFLNDYEGIGGHESYRPELGVMYFPTVSRETGKLVQLIMTPTRVQRFRVNRADDDDTRWLCAMLDRESRPLGSAVQRLADNTLSLQWEAAG